MAHKALKDSLKSSRILVVDDQKFNIILLTKLLKEMGFTSIVTASNGVEALEKTKAFRPDIIILDLLMPEMDGFEYCRKLRQIPEFENIPILVQTILGSSDEKAKAFECGASDFISKPIDHEEFIARIIVHTETQRLYNDLKASQERISHELMAARDMQMTLVPSRELIAGIFAAHQMEIMSCFQPSFELGGDIWGCRSLSKNELAVYIADFSGHGVSAALNTFRLQALIEAHPQKDIDPGTYLTLINNDLRKMLNRGQFATMFYGIINHQDETIRYATASTPSPIILEKNAPHVTMLNGNGFPLGVLDTVYETKIARFSRGSMLMIYSDALIETEDTNGQFFSETAIAETLKDLYLEPHEFQTQYVFSTFMKKFNDEYMSRVKDDLTIAVINNPQ